MEECLKWAKQIVSVVNITIVVYNGEKSWDGATALHRMLNIPEKITKYVNDYKMILIGARENKLTLHSIKNKELFDLLQLVLDRSIAEKEAMQKAIKISKNDILARLQSKYRKMKKVVDISVYMM